MRGLGPASGRRRFGSPAREQGVRRLRKANLNTSVTSNFAVAVPVEFDGRSRTSPPTGGPAEAAPRTRMSSRAASSESWGNENHTQPRPTRTCYIVDTMNYTVGIRELRQQASAVLKRVVSGEVVDVTDHGHPIARIVPRRPGVLDQLVLEGRATDVEKDLIDALDEMGLPAQRSGGMRLSDALAELRSDDR